MVGLMLAEKVGVGDSGGQNRRAELAEASAPYPNTPIISRYIIYPYFDSQLLQRPWRLGCEIFRWGQLLIIMALTR